MFAFALKQNVKCSVQLSIKLKHHKNTAQNTTQKLPVWTFRSLYFVRCMIFLDLYKEIFIVRPSMLKRRLKTNLCHLIRVNVTSRLSMSQNIYTEYIYLLAKMWLITVLFRHFWDLQTPDDCNTLEFETFHVYNCSKMYIDYTYDCWCVAVTSCHLCVGAHAKHKQLILQFYQPGP